MGSIEEPVQPEGVAVIIATRGRPDIVRDLVERLAKQSRTPDHIFVIGSKADDIAQLPPHQPHVTARVGRVGLTLQRNDGLALAGERFSYIVFFDDDFVPSRFWLERLVGLFEARPDIAGLTGAVLADGTTTAGIALGDAHAIVERHDANPARGGYVEDEFAYGGNMGCNMAFRYAAMRGLRFDERLPLYAWLEDADFRGQVARQGRVARANALWGVHLGHKPGRGRGVTLGYSQIANAVYLARKGTVPTSFLANRAIRNILSNTARSFRPEPFIDRRGRLWGNIIALADIVRGRIAPERVLAL
jgi:GT2 family glycosyltransferase